MRNGQITMGFSGTARSGLPQAMCKICVSHGLTATDGTVDDTAEAPSKCDPDVTGNRQCACVG